MKENRQFTPEISFRKEHADMAEWKKLPVGLENFQEIEKNIKNKEILIKTAE